MLTVLAGDPGGGKSTLSAYIAAVVTTGRPWIDSPDGPPQKTGRVLFLTAEDDTARTLVPRLTAAGADLSLVEVIEGVRLTQGGDTELFGLDTDVGLLKEALEKYPDTKLIVVDPITAYLGNSARDSHNTSVMRRLLAPLKTLCEETGVTILVISHLNKGCGGTNATYRVTGSLALPAHARAVFLLGCEPKNEKRRYLLCSKINVGPMPPGLAFEVSGDPPVIQWLSDPVTMTARELLAKEQAHERGSAAVDEAKLWLETRLANGSVQKRELEKEAKATGIREAALQKASAALGVIKEPGSFGGSWIWRLPRRASPPIPSDRPSVPQSPQVPPVSGVPHHTGGNICAPPPPKACPMCSAPRWWRRPDDALWTCGNCHPPVHLGVLWWEPPHRSSSNESPSP
jgi:hypothetical protein